MGIIDTLKWLWDPHTEEEKRYKTDPLRCYKQPMKVYILGIDVPFDIILEYEDIEFYGEKVRVDIDQAVRESLNAIAKNGILIHDSWYPPSQIDRIELEKPVVEDR